MQDDRVQPNSIQEAQTQRELLHLVKHRASYFDDGEPGWVGWMRGGREDSKVAFDFAFSADGIEETGDCFLRFVRVKSERQNKRQEGAPCRSAGQPLKMSSTSSHAPGHM